MLIAHIMLIYLELKSNKSAAGDYYKQTKKVVYIDFFYYNENASSASDSKL